MNPLLRAIHYTHYYLRFNGTALILITEHCVSPPEALPQSRRWSWESTQEFADGHFLHLSDSSPASLHLPHTLFSRQYSQFCSRVVQSFSFLQFFSPAFKRRTSSSLSFVHKRLREENICRQWVNIQSLISEIARNRSGNANFSVASWRWWC